MFSLLFGSLLSTAEAVPLQLSQQGRLVDSSGTAATGNHSLTFRLYNASTGGTLLWSETVSTTFTNGYYSVVLGSDTINNPLQDSVLESGQLYVELEVDSAGPLSPRSTVTSTPFARVAGKAEVADSVDWTGITSVPSGLDSADTRLSALEALMTTVQADLATANATIASLETDLTSAQSDLATATGNITTLETNLATANTTIGSLQTELAAAQATIGTHTTEIGLNTTEIAALDTDLTTAEGNITTLQGEMATAQADISTLQSDVTDLQSNVLDLIDVDTTWTIGSTGDYANLADAMAAARTVHIHPDATLTLQLQDGVYSHTSGINLYHPDGRHLKITGNSGDKTAVQLYFVGSDGLYLDNGNLRGLSYLHLVGDSTAGTVGIEVVKNATLFADNLLVEDFEYNIITRYDSYMQLLGDSVLQNPNKDNLNVAENAVFVKTGSTTSLDILNAGANGISLNFGGVATLFNTHVSGSADDGLDPRWGSIINFEGGSTSNGNASDGAQVQFGSVLRGYNASFDNNAGNGIWNYHGASDYLVNITASNNSGAGVANSRGSSTYVSSSVLNGNAYGFNTYAGSYGELSSSVTTSNNSTANRNTNSDGHSNYSNQ